jgi:hypothetical protein
VDDESADRQALLTTLTTEHFTLQGARSQTIGESAARSSLYMFSLYRRAINRIRHYYLELAGENAGYFLMSGHDDPRGVLASAGVETRFPSP